MSYPKARSNYRRRLQNLADDLNGGVTDLDELLRRAEAPKRAGRVPRRALQPTEKRQVCNRCLEPRPLREFPPDERHPNDRRGEDGLLVCLPCLHEAREVEAVRRLVYGDVGAWAARRLADEGLLLAPWGEEARCPHCSEPSPQTPAYTWACRHGWQAGVCQGLLRPHVHSICKVCGYEALYDEPEGTGERRIA